MRTAALALCLSGTAGQERPAPEVIVPDRVTCAACSITRTTVVRLGSSSLEGEIAEKPLHVREGPRGEYWVLTDLMPPRVYAATGAYLRTVGRKGRGPGEYESPSDVVWLPGDSILVIDGLARRATVLAPGGRPARYVQDVPPMHGTTILSWPTRVLAFASTAARGGAVPPYRLVNFAGEQAVNEPVAQASGAATYPGPRPPDWHHVARSRDGRVHVATTRAPFIHEWAEPGRVRRTFVRSASGFPAEGASAIGTPESPPPTTVAGLDVDDAGRIWLFKHVAAPTWRNGWADVPRGAREAPVRLFDMPALMNTEIEVIDPVRGVVLARAQLPGFTIAVLRGGRVAVMGHSPLGEGEVRIDQVTFKGGAPR